MTNSHPFVQNLGEFEEIQNLKKLKNSDENGPWMKLIDCIYSQTSITFGDFLPNDDIKNDFFIEVTDYESTTRYPLEYIFKLKDDPPPEPSSGTNLWNFLRILLGFLIGVILMAIIFIIWYKFCYFGEEYEVTGESSFRQDLGLDLRKIKDKKYLDISRVEEEEDEEDKDDMNVSVVKSASGRLASSLAQTTETNRFSINNF